jgi:hypothetical protein
MIAMPALPILTLDERVLSPRFGYLFQARWLEPYESVLGMLWKFVRANRLSGPAVVAQIGAAPTDPYEGLEPIAAQVDCRVVARLLQVRPSSVAAGLRRSLSDRAAFKYCARCLAAGYHGIVHQADGRRVCPVHRCALHEGCRHCRRGFAFRLDARLLDAPFRCPSCRSYLASPTSVRFAEQKRFGSRERAAITRSMLA